ncbi:hypothetical protein CAEBREN_17504 [Caenorhabditis brenneri]|uniref:C-type lectin domain-containing protein n=1 Tax=Caenorhabditis brenneri TaxID=135651 RepID=G0M941_CAEBE|nr:hypothetical protein CAEBREN_17504 [Caenorhabditis brenneri]
MKLFLLTTLLTSAYAHLACPSGFTLVLDECLKIIPNPLTHTQAEVDCTYLGGTLVNVHSAIKNRAVSEFASKSRLNKIWLGLFCFSNQNSSSCYHDDNSGTASVYNNFAPGYPLINGIYGGCVYMSTEGSLAGKWVSVECEAESMPFVCEVPSTHYDPTCTHNYGGYCYYPSTELNTTFATFPNAQSICQQEFNGNLASIHSKRENDYVISLFRGNIDAEYVLLGAQDLLPNTFSWIDGSNYAAFDYRDPLDPGTADCLGMEMGTGLWKRVGCTARIVFLCKRSISKTVTSTPKTHLVTSNPSDFSNCNTTFLMAPGVITSYGYLSTTPSTTFCTWKIVTLGAYRIRLSFVDYSSPDPVYLYDEYGREITYVVSSNRAVVSPTNIMNVTFQDRGIAGFRGFKAVAQPY